MYVQSVLDQNVVMQCMTIQKKGTLGNWECREYKVGVGYAHGEVLIFRFASLLGNWHTERREERQ